MYGKYAIKQVVLLFQKYETIRQVNSSKIYYSEYLYF